jgi:hypothetical protein
MYFSPTPRPPVGVAEELPFQLALQPEEEPRLEPPLRGQGWAIRSWVAA